ncbi:hypothetical protein [Streptomyces sp. NPDC059651]|uniref:hypothetical protein n=1 Tax=Streptomyces sp. NPDC059651 TaxID=3346897 RepID=UPI0036AFA630
MSGESASATFMAEPTAAFAPEQLTRGGCRRYRVAPEFPRLAAVAAVAAVGQGRPMTEPGVGGGVVDDDMLVEGECRRFVGCWATV